MQIIDLKQQPRHIPAIAAWHFAEWAHLNPGRSEAWLQEHMRCYLTDACIPSMFIAVDNQGAVQGTSSIIAHDLAARPDLTPWLANVYVAASQRGKGLGKQLVQYAMQQAKQAGIHTLYLFTPDQQDFYQRMGWEYLCTEYLHGHAETVMQIHLADWSAPL